jgi:hypothetical protein
LTSRICAHKLEIEKSRYFQITERFCKICSAKNIGKKEKYYLKKYLYTIKKIPNFQNDTMKSK